MPHFRSIQLEQFICSEMDCVWEYVSYACWHAGSRGWSSILVPVHCGVCRLCPVSLTNCSDDLLTTVVTSRQSTAGWSTLVVSASTLLHRGWTILSRTTGFNLSVSTLTKWPITWVIDLTRRQRRWVSPLNYDFESGCVKFSICLPFTQALNTNLSFVLFAK